MDDIKVHAPNKNAAKLITEKLRQTASELSLSLTIQKCGIHEIQESAQYHSEEIVEVDLPFLPTIRDHYKYLVLYQFERD